ncbi:MAG: ATP synthase F1 subunit delta [Flavobacteriales bacterium]|nr:ATP synthase F1 subunit delta [Flavobacteriales bacterium]|tara:strand:- start:17989 stop:18522 length:534 start_codon:yes stop_codon:yes gene_type:complete
MQKSSASIRYAKALFDLSLEQNVTETTLADLRLIYSLLKRDKNFKTLTTNPTIKKNIKKTIFLKTLSGKISSICLNFLLLVINKGREPLLNDLIEKYETIYNKHNKIRIIQTVSARPLTEEQKSILVDKMNADGSKIKLIEQVDAKLLGGIIIKKDGVQFDASIRKKIKNARRAFKL